MKESFLKLDKNIENIKYFIKIITVQSVNYRIQICEQYIPNSFLECSSY